MHHHAKRALCVLVSLSVLFTLLSALTLSTIAASDPITPDIAVGDGFIIVQTNKGEVWGWGDNSDGVLGPARSNEINWHVTAPVKITLPNAVKSTAISAGFDHVLCLGSDGNVYAWGKNEYGQLGTAVTNDPIKTPTKVEGLSGKNITAIAAGYQFSIALGSDGKVYSFGANNFCQLGYELQDATYSTAPTQISALSNASIKKISAGYQSAAAIDATGKAYLWGSTKNYLLGVDETPNPLPPTLMTQTTSVISAALTNTYSAFLLENGTVGFMGSNAYGQYGNEETDATFSKVFKVTDTSTLNIKDIAVSDQQTVLLGTNGKVYTAGNRLPNNAESASNTFVPLFDENEKTAIAIAAGYQNAAMIASDGSVWVWGNNSCGQLGNGTEGNDGSATPAKVFGSDDFSYIMDRSSHTKDVPLTFKTTVPAPTYTITIPSTIAIGELRQTDPNADNRYSWTEFEISAQNVANLFGEKQIQVSVSPGSGNTFCLQDGHGNTIPFALFDSPSSQNAMSGNVLVNFTKSNQKESTWIRIDQSQLSKSGIYSGTLTFHYSVVNIPQNNTQE